MRHARMTWLCVGLLAVGVIGVAAGLTWITLLLVVPCMLMMGAMVWTMLTRSGGSDDPRR